MTSKIALPIAAVAAFALVSAALAQGAPGPRPPLVPCTPETTGPCVTVATSLDDLVGVWKQYMGNPAFNAPDGMAFIRYRPDGSFSLGPTVESTAAPVPPFPTGTVRFDGDVLILSVESANVPPECRSARHQAQVIRLGATPVALFFTPIEDDCVIRRADLGTPLIRAAD